MDASRAANKEKEQKQGAVNDGKGLGTCSENALLQHPPPLVHRLERP